MKCISIFLVFSLLYSSMIGCSTKIIKDKTEIRDALNSGNMNYILSGIQKKDDLLSNDNIYIHRTDGTTYYFSSGMYKFQFDTLYGEGHQILENQRLEAIKIKIGLNEI